VRAFLPPRANRQLDVLVDVALQEPRPERQVVTLLDHDIQGRVFDLTHAVNVLRKERGLEVSDRIRLELPAGDADLLELYRERIAEETLAVEIEVGEALDLVKT